MSTIALPETIAPASAEIGQRGASTLLSRCKTAFDLRVGIAAFAVVVVTINTAVVIHLGRSELQDTIRDAVAQNSALAAEFEHSTSRTLGETEDVAQSIRREYAHSGRAIPLAEMRAEGAIDRQLFVAASVIDEQGTVVASTDPAPEIAARAGVRAEAAAFHAQQDGGGLFVGTPAKPALAGKALVPVSLRQNKADGSFGGFVLLLLEPARFTDFVPIAPEKDGILTLVGLDGIVRARRSGSRSTAGEDLRASSLFTELATRSSGESLSASPVDGVRRFFSFRRMAEYPLVVGAAVSETDALGPVHQRRMWYYARATVLTVIIGLLSALVIRALSRRNRAIAQLSNSRETLRAREEELRTLTETMPQIVWSSAPEGGPSFFNQRWTDFTGLSLTASQKNGWAAALHPDDAAKVSERWRHAMEHGDLFEMEFRLRRADGAYHWMLGRALPLTDATGRITKWFGTSTDIEGQMAAQTRVREQAELLDQTDDAIIVRDADDRIRFWNRGAEKLYGWSADEVLGKRAQDFGKSDLARREVARKGLAENGKWSGEMDHFRKDGSIVTVNSRWTSVSEGQSAGSTLVVSTDLTEQKKQEAHLLRTQRLESIGTLASGVAHDLNNILAPIMMAAPLLRDEMPAKKRDQLVSLLEQSADRGAAIVRQVLTFARGADGERVLVQPVYALKEIAEIASETFPKSITVQASYPEDLALIEADPTQLHQVLLNLCVNARDAMPDGGVLSLSGENFDVDEHFAAMTPGLKAGPHCCSKSAIPAPAFLLR